MQIVGTKPLGRGMFLSMQEHLSDARRCVAFVEVYSIVVRVRYTQSVAQCCNVSSMARCAARLCCLAALAVAPAYRAAHAAPLPHADQQLTYTVVDQDLPGLLVGVAEQLGLRANVSAKVQGRVRGRIPTATAQETLDHLAGVYGFDWYCDGQTLYVSNFSEATTKVLSLGAVSDSDLLHTLDVLNVTDPRWPIRFSASRDVAIVNGPPSYVGLVDQTLVALSERLKAGTATVSVFRGSAAGGA